VTAAFAVIEVPAMAGDPVHPAADGPRALTAGLAARGLEPRAVLRAAVPGRSPDSRTASIEVAAATAAHVREAVTAGALPLVIAGSCDVAPAVLAGIRDARAGVVWIDAHADFNTPSSSASGFWPGMTLAVVVGGCGEEVWSRLDWVGVRQEAVALIGVRSLSPDAEAERLRASALHVVPWRDGAPEGSVEEALDALRARVERVYVHLDLDALDPAVGTGIVDPPVPGGLSADQLRETLMAVRERFEITAATIATYTPSRDDGRTLAAALDAADLLLE
jgi:arginase